MDTGTVINISKADQYGLCKNSCSCTSCFNDCWFGYKLFQTLTSIQEQTLTFVPKLIAILLTLMLLGAWMLNQITGFMGNLWNFSQYI